MALQQMIHRQPVSLAVLSEFVSLKDLVSLLTALQQHGGAEIMFVPVSTSRVSGVVERSLRKRSTQLDLLSFKNFQLVRYGDAQMQAMRSLLRSVHVAIQALPVDFGRFKGAARSVFSEVTIEEGSCEFTVAACSFTFIMQQVSCTHCERISLLSCTRCKEMLGTCKECSQICPVNDCPSRRVCDDCAVIHVDTEDIVGCVDCRFLCGDCTTYLPVSMLACCDAEACINDTPANRCLDCQEDLGIDTRECTQCHAFFCFECKDFRFCALCERPRCISCDGYFDCMACNLSFCKACEPSFTCAACQTTFCIECRQLFLCIGCGQDYCEPCVALQPYNLCCECDVACCSCTQYVTCEGCDATICASCAAVNEANSFLLLESVCGPSLSHLDDYLLDCDSQASGPRHICSECVEVDTIHCGGCGIARYSVFRSHESSFSFSWCERCGGSLCGVCFSALNVCHQSCDDCGQVGCALCEGRCCCCDAYLCKADCCCGRLDPCSGCGGDVCAACSSGLKCPTCAQVHCVACSESLCEACDEAACPRCAEGLVVDCAACKKSYHRACVDFVECEGCFEEHCVNCVEDSLLCLACGKRCPVCTCEKEMFTCRLCEHSFCACTDKYTCGVSLWLPTSSFSLCDCGHDFCSACAGLHEGGGHTPCTTASQSTGSSDSDSEEDGERD